MIKEVISLANTLSTKYDSNIRNLIKDYNCKILFKELKNKIAYTVKLENMNYIIINNNVNKNYLDFILAHEFYHALKHDSTIRQFSKFPLATDKYELQANLFATVFLGCTYQDCNNNYVQKIVNNILCNYCNCDLN